MRVAFRWLSAWEIVDVQTTQDVRTLRDEPLLIVWPEGMGRYMGWDHIALLPVANGAHVNVLAWNDDPTDWPDGPWGVFDTMLDGFPATYFGRNDRHEFPRLFSEFPASPPANRVRHGQWVDDETWATISAENPWVE